ncbi:MAG: 50S ribosomal protein L10 [Candidatus Marinimicrobia bacterium]|jgi:large subunit ribosomal protein L10|nr:50S ribosomal protein L10 [Candidatus Neomarinimicrobiota bacterium]MBT4370638.1 50S ribosomal protein L10 [Candidatus Neomarinimicrobiota bacterium]MBT5225002.1 50S ribosomal protein L10 [Candidatus Neomarinimicrobiota bacterium]MBT5720740.1 50S ribosomal protein L10 [Candidatus Neomarinimicrobiota bacterium]MBT6517441.1 50S ribosomal protein L10 [Candidatus Neomarinimicrobiota bacterium]
MPNNKNIEQVKELKETFSKAKAIYFTEYHGLNVGDITKLRSEFFKADVEYKVAKNTLIKLAAEQNKISGLDEVLIGSTAIAIAYTEPVAPAKVIKEFTKDNDLPTVKGILFDGEFLPGEEFKKLADMPSKEESLSQLVAMLNSPLQKLVSTLIAPIQNAVGVLNNLKEKNS